MAAKNRHWETVADDRTEKEMTEYRLRTQDQADLDDVDGLEVDDDEPDVPVGGHSVVDVRVADLE